MSEEKHEALSAFIDGELAEDKGVRIVDEVLSDTSLTQRWSSYHLIGEVMRRHSHGLSPEQKPGSAAVTPISSGRLRVPAMRPAAGLALAASVALAAVIAIFAVSSSAPPVVETARVETPAAVAAARAPVEVALGDRASGGPAQTVEPPRVTGSAATQRLTWNDAEPEVANRLNGYLVNHNEYLSSGMRGMLPYARIVAYDSGRDQ